MPPWQQGHLPPTLPTLSILQMFSMLVCNCNFFTMNYCKHCYQNCIKTSYSISSSCSISSSVSVQLCHQFNDTPLLTFMISSFYFKAFSCSRTLMFISLGAWCSIASCQQQVTCVGGTLTTIVKVQHRWTKLARCFSVTHQWAPSGSADFCDIRLVSFCPK